MHADRSRQYRARGRRVTDQVRYWGQNLQNSPNRHMLPLSRRNLPTSSLACA
jgi:hypothetical protein